MNPHSLTISFYDNLNLIIFSTNEPPKPSSIQASIPNSYAVLIFAIFVTDSVGLVIFYLKTATIFPY